jgi:hypothetical protein
VFEDQLLAGLRQSPREPGARSAVRVQLRLPWYRSLPLACIERLEITIDGAPQPLDSMAFVINGTSHPVARLAELQRVWWFVLDPMDVEVPAVERLEPGVHEVTATLALLVPYGDPDFRPQLNIRQVADCTRRLTLAGRDD